MQSLSFLEIISIITALQLFLLGFVLMANRTSQSKRILSWFMFANGLLLVYFLFSLYNSFNIPNISIFYYLLSPLLYLYVRSLCEKKFSFKSAYLVHGFVFAIMVLYVIIMTLFISPSIREKWGYPEYLISQIILHFQIAAYVIASFVSINKYRREIKNHFSAVEHINLSWLLIILTAFTVMWLADFITFILTVFNIKSGNTIYILLLISISINFLFANFLVYKGLRQPDVFSGIRIPEKYSGSNISESASIIMANRLKAYMLEHKPYLNPDLTIRDLSEELNMHHKSLSQVINSQFNQKFYDFVNYYRVMEAKKMMTKNTDENITILEILYEVGFNSKSAFNNAFKKNTGKTPTEFKKLNS